MRKIKLTPLILLASVFGLSACTLPKWLSFLSFIPGLDAPNEEDDDDEGFVPIDHSPRIKETYGDYTLAKSVVDGGQYILGVFRHESGQMRFFNGDYHRDGDSYYPYYLGTDADSTENAAVITVHMVSSTEFSMQVSSPGNPWDGKYIGVYSAHGSGGGAVMSIAVLDSPDQTEYVQPGDEIGGQTDPTYGFFKFHTTCNNQTVYAPAADYKHEEDGDKKANPKFLGTAGNFISIDCKDYQVATDGLAYDLAHLYAHN